MTKMIFSEGEQRIKNGFGSCKTDHSKREPEVKKERGKERRKSEKNGQGKEEKERWSRIEHI